MNLRLLVSLAAGVGAITIHPCQGQHNSPGYTPPKFASTHVLKSRGLAIRFSPDSKLLMVAGSTGRGLLVSSPEMGRVLKFEDHERRLRLWNVGKRREMATLAAQPILDWQGQDVILLMPDFKTLITSWGAWRIRVVDVHKRWPDQVVDVNVGNISDVAISPDGKILAFGLTREVQFRDAQTFELLRTYHHGGQGTQVRFGTTSRIVALSWWGNKTQYVDIDTAKQIRVGPLLEFQTTLAPDKKHFVWVKDGTQIELWVKEPTGDRKLKTWKSSLAEIRDIQFSPNGKTLAVAGLSSTETPVEFYNVAAVD